LLHDWQNAAVASNTPEKWLVSHFMQDEDHKTLLHDAIITRITQVAKQGTAVASATTVDVPPWSDALVTGNSGAVAFWEAQGPPVPAKPCASRAMPARRQSHCFSPVPPIFVRNPDHCKMAACLRRLMQSMTEIPRLHTTPGNQLHSPLPPHIRKTFISASDTQENVMARGPHIKSSGCFRP
jgi:hypothetical protein